MAMTTGTKIWEILSTSFCTGALRAWASVTSLAMWARVVSLPTRVARTTNLPEVFSVAPVTGSSGPFSTGTDSQVIMDSSTAECPWATMPSVAIFSPGRTTNRSPTCKESAAIRTSLPSRSTVASFAPIANSARSAAEDCPLARVSNQRPSRRKEMTTEADSR